MEINHHRLLPLPAGKQFQCFALDIASASIGLLPDEHELIVNAQSGHYMLINWDVRYVAADGQFSQAELPFILVLLGAWPSYVPNRKLLQSVTNRSASEIAEILDIAYVQAVEPLRQMAESCRRQLRQIGIDIESVQDLGYKLGRWRERGQP